MRKEKVSKIEKLLTKISEGIDKLLSQKTQIEIVVKQENSNFAKKFIKDIIRKSK